MKHISKFDGCIYEISYSMTNENGQRYDDDITLIWRNTPCYVDEQLKVDLPLMEFVNWYAGEYDYDATEYYIKKYYEKKLKASEASSFQQLQTIDLPICYVNLIEDCLQAIKQHNLFALLSYDEDCVGDAQAHLEEVLEKFCAPLEEIGDDVKIIK